MKIKFFKPSLLFIIVGMFILTAFISSCSVQQEENKDVDYYTCGMHPSVHILPDDYAKGQTQCPICNMDLIPVMHQDEMEKIAPKTPTAAPEHDAMEMSSAESLKIPQEQLKRAGVLTEKIARRLLCRDIRSVGKVAYDPELVVVQEELVSSLNALDKITPNSNSEIKVRAEELVASAKKKLEIIGLSAKEIEEISSRRQAEKGLILPDKQMWVYADIYEYELGWVQEGAQAVIKSESFPGETFDGNVSAIEPVIDPLTRSIVLRIKVSNPDLKLKPNMYVDVLINGICAKDGQKDKVLALPKSAVLDTGKRKVAWIETEDGVFQRRLVELGAEATADVDGQTQVFYQVLKGVKEGERVVTKGNFLIDSQSQLSGMDAGSSYSGALAPEESTMQH